MDELLGYGSDSSGSSECSNRGKNNDSISRQTTKTTSHLDGLLVGYGDCDSSDEENEGGTSDHNGFSFSNNKGLERGALRSEQALDSDSHVAKKAKISKMSSNVNGEDSIATADKNIPLVPRLRLPTDDSYDSLILFRKDYLLTKLRKKYCIGTQKQEDQVHGKQLLDTLSQLQNNGTSSFARTLKSQKEFGNPHLFSEIISHFEIDPLESNICLQQGNTIESGTVGGEEKEKERKLTFERFEYVDRLVQKEEEIRNRTLL